MPTYTFARIFGISLYCGSRESTIYQQGGNTEGWHAVRCDRVPKFSYPFVFVPTNPSPGAIAVLHILLPLPMVPPSSLVLGLDAAVVEPHIRLGKRRGANTRRTVQGYGF